MLGGRKRSAIIAVCNCYLISYYLRLLDDKKNSAALTLH